MEIDVRLRGLTPAIVAEVERIGMRIVGAYYEYGRIVGFCDLELLGEIASIPEVTTIHPNYGAQTRTGSVTTQGDATIRADDARMDFGRDGTGAQIGILSDSFHATPAIGGNAIGSGCSRTLTGSNPQNSNDLPPSVIILDNCDSAAATCGIRTDEGAAMAELVHDVAPGAAIMFHSAFNSEADFAQGITELVACGADVLIDDVIWFSEPMFQDGIISQAVENAVASGVSYFTAAGNEGGFGMDEVYLDADPVMASTVFPTDGVDLHDFGGDNRFATISIPAGCGIRLVLQWNQPFSGTLGPGASSDLDIYLCDSESLALNADNPPSLLACDFNNSLAIGADEQGCGGGNPPLGDPFETLSFMNDSGVPVTTFVAVDHACGSQDVRFRIVPFGINCTLTDPGYTFEGPGIFDKSPIYGHPAAVAANTVAAIFYGEADTGGALEAPDGQIDVKPSSSLGGLLPFYFDTTGNPLPGAPVIRSKPDMAGPEGTNNTFFGSDISFDADSFPNFFGTSPAASHAGAVAALLIDTDPTVSPGEIRSALRSTALDVEAVGTDFLSGAGLIQAYAAVFNVFQCQEAGVNEVQNLRVATTSPGSSVAILSWNPDASATGYNVYQAQQANLADLMCLDHGLTETTTMDDGGFPSDLVVYLVTATNCRGESTLGFADPGPERLNPLACP